MKVKIQNNTFISATGCNYHIGKKMPYYNNHTLSSTYLGKQTSEQ